jgi:hypothetical protein
MATVKVRDDLERYFNEEEDEERGIGQVAGSTSVTRATATAP